MMTAPVISPTPRQRQLLCYIQAHQAHHDGQTPSLIQMAAALGLTEVSISNAHTLLRGLQERGHIRRSLCDGRIHVDILHPPIVSHAPDGAPLYFIPVGALPVSHEGNNA